MLVGEPPQTRHFGPTWPEVSRFASFGCVMSLSLHFLIPAVAGYGQQAVYIGLDRHDLPHIRLGLLVLLQGIPALCRQLFSLRFEGIHAWQLSPGQQPRKSGPRLPVCLDVGLMLRKIFLAVP